ncbi:MAG: PAS domain S-box protein [Flectobacillus sp.]|uniref:PAS domain S-box protein n=1 Tax=Flectobacillus sp. TaxID=50419 RepID=UPI003B9C9B1B
MNKLSGEMLTAIINSVTESFVLVSPTHEVLHFNTSMSTILESFFGKKIALGDDYRNFVLQSLKPLYQTAFEKALRGEFTVVQNLTTNKEHNVWFEYRINPVYSENQQFVGVAIYAKNIDRQKKAELEVESIKKTYESLLNNISDSICLLDVDFKVIQYNTHIERVLLSQVGKKIYIGADFREYLFPNETEEFFRQFEQACAGKIVEDEICVHNIQGEAVWILSKMYPVYDQKQALLGVCIVAININAKKKMELSIMENEQRFRKIINTAPVPIVIVDKTMKIQMVNPETEKIFNYQPNELDGKNINVLIPKRFHLKHSYHQQTYIQSPKMYKMGLDRYTPAITKDGIEKTVEVSLNSFQVDEETFVLAIIQDVTKRIEHEHRLENQVEALEKIAWQQSHEIRKPVANILGLVQLIEYDQAYNPLLINQLHQTAQELDDVIHKIVNLTHQSR